MAKKSNRPWIAMYSQTGSELYEICKALKRYPDQIISDSFCRGKTVNDLNETICKKTTFLLQRVTKGDYPHIMEDFDKNPIITLHGWLNIVPQLICEEYEIYNGHPGLITKYPILMGKDPQKKAVELGLEESGCVIHRVSPGVDEGEILVSKPVNIKGFSLDKTIEILHNASIKLWVEFLKEKLNAGS